MICLLSSKTIKSTLWCFHSVYCAHIFFSSKSAKKPNWKYLEIPRFLENIDRIISVFINPRKIDFLTCASYFWWRQTVPLGYFLWNYFRSVGKHTTQTYIFSQILSFIPEIQEQRLILRYSNFAIKNIISMPLTSSLVKQRRWRLSAS